MAEEQQSQSQQAATSTTQAQTSQTTQATTGGDTLEAVYKEFNVDAMAASFKPQDRQQQTRTADTQSSQTQHQATGFENMPDPVLDAAGFKAWQAQQVGALRQGHQQLSGVLQQITAAEQRRQDEHDISAAVQKVKAAGFDADDEVIEVHLGLKARKDPRFLTIYNNRQANPQAWNRALAAFANEAKGQHSFKTDSTLAENVRAAKQSTQTSQTTQQTQEPSGDEKRFAGKTGPAFDSEWQRYVSRGM